MKEFNFDPSKTRAAKLLIQRKATEEIWRRGEFVDLLLKGPQKDMYEFFKNNGQTMTFFLCSRRLGKSFTLLSIAVAECLKKAGTRVLYLSTTTDQVREICDQTADVVLETCPAELRPIVKQKENKYVFKNGSEIRVKGLDKTGGNAIRGVKAHLAIFDEACFMVDLENTVRSVVLPQVIASGGRILFGSTPPDTPGHESIQFIANCEENNSLIKKTIYDMQGVLYTDRQIAEFEKQAGGEESTVFRREYLAEIVTEETLAIVPSFDDDKREELVQILDFPNERENVDYPKFWPDCYVGMDLGFRDLTVALFGYWDYPHARLVIQDELIWDDKRATTDVIAKDIKAKEEALWGQKPYGRFCDNDPRFIEDIKKLHDLHFKRTDKDKKEAHVNQLNILVNDSKLIIDPRCKTLIKHLRYGLWKDNRREFQRTKELSHCDAIDALIYLMRNINKVKNPLPHVIKASSQYAMHDWNAALNGEESSLDKTFKTLFGVR